MADKRCDLSDLIPEHCMHCVVKARNLGPTHGELFDYDDEEMDQA